MNPEQTNRARWVRWAALPALSIALGCSAAGSEQDLFGEPTNGTAGGQGGASHSTEPSPGSGGADQQGAPPNGSDGEVCGNGLDDNGNGFLDEACACDIDATQLCYPGVPSQAGKGACTLGTQRCVADSNGELTGSHWGACEGYGGAQPEVCDGVDNDCDGTTDNGCACTAGDVLDCATACGPGVQPCEQGVWADCNARQPTAEVCDGIDNDCNNEVDENLTQGCSSPCGSGIRLCHAGSWGACNAPTNCPDPCATVVCQGACCPAGAACCSNGACPNAAGQCPSVCATVQCQGTCCPTGTQCCWDGACPDGWGNCPAQCQTFKCQGVCCAAGTGCCSNGACPDANGHCPSSCATVVCNSVCCPNGTHCCSNGACPDATTGQCDSELAQCVGQPDAEVYAHSGFTLYRVDPSTKALTTVGAFSGCAGWQMIDVAMNKNGDLYGTTTKNVARINKNTGACTLLASGSDYPNSLSFVPEGTIDPNHETLVGYSFGDYMVIDTQDGSMSKVGALPSGYKSSGDLVSIAGVGTFLTVTGNGCSDCILRVDPKTGGMIENKGPVGYPSVYGLAFWKGDLYGFTKGGALFIFDLATSSATLTPMPGAPSPISFNGAASTTCAPEL